MSIDGPGTRAESPRSIAVVGASLAGARAARALRARGFDGRIHLVGAERHPPYDRPPLSKGVLTGAVLDTTLEADGFWAEQRIELVLGRSVVALHPAERQVEISGGRRIGADRVLLCTGGRARRLAVPGADLPGVYCLRTADDAAAIRARLGAGARVVVVGAGFIGAEVAAAARTLGCDVTLVEIAQVPLWRVLGEEMGRHYGQVHRDHGVSLRTGVGVAEILGAAAVTGVRLGDGSTVGADLVVVGVGIEPATELAVGIGAAIDPADRGIVVDEFCETTVPGVFAAGDVASHPNAILGARVRLEHWRNAQNQGPAAAASMLGERIPFREVPWFWSDQYDMALQMAGHPSAADETVRRGEPGGSDFSVFYLRAGVVTAVLGINRPRDVRAGMDLIAHRMPIDGAVLADPDTDLRALTRTARAQEAGSR